MTMDDSELRRRFTQLRDADRERTPTFAQTNQRARARSASRVPMGVRPLAIAAVATVLTATVWMARARSFSHSEIAPEIATWRAPTDVLLDTPGSELLDAMPALGASVLDKMIPTHSMRGT
jgi:hypothetical protein